MVGRPPCQRRWPGVPDNVKAHTSEADIGTKISAVDRNGADLADETAKAAMAFFLRDADAFGRFAAAETRWIGLVSTLDLPNDCDVHRGACWKVLGTARGRASMRKWPDHEPRWDIDGEI